MAITRRQFVTRMGALAAAAGLSQADVARLTEAFAYGSPGLGGQFGKPRVVWIHGAECTGCSTSVLGIFEDTAGTALYEFDSNNPLKAKVTTGGAAGLAGVLPTSTGSGSDFTYHFAGYNVEGYSTAMNIADVVVDVIDLKYHETVMGMGGDLAYKWLDDFITTADNDQHPFVLVVEGAMQDARGGGAWGETNTSKPWCSIAMNDAGTAEHDMAHTVAKLAKKDSCIGVVAIGQCATFGGYPGCKPATQVGFDSTVYGFDNTKSQTGALGAHEFLSTYVKQGVETDAFQAAVRAAAGKVVNVPGCPTNPWWFVLSVVIFLVEYVNGPAASTNGPLGILDSNGAIVGGVDATRRLKLVYGTPIHGPACPRYQDFLNNNFATKPGAAGCLQLIGCKGPSTNSQCTLHGWNGQQPENPDAWDYNVATTNLSANGRKTGGFCISAGHPCMGCTEKGYPDSMVPFVVR